MVVKPCSASRGEGAAESTPLEPSERSVESPANSAPENPPSRKLPEQWRRALIGIIRQTTLSAALLVGWAPIGVGAAVFLSARQRHR